MDRLDCWCWRPASSFITVLTGGRHWTPCWPRRIQSLVPFILICLPLQNQGLSLFFQAFLLKYCTWAIFLLCVLYPSSFLSSTIWSPHNIVSSTNHEAPHNAVFCSLLVLDPPYVKLSVRQYLSVRCPTDFLNLIPLQFPVLMRGALAMYWMPAFFMRAFLVRVLRGRD